MTGKKRKCRCGNESSLHKREYKMPRVKDEIKKAIRLLAAIECHSEVVNETIYLYLTTENFIAKNVKINGRRYRIVKGVAKVPFNRKNWDLILKNKIRVDLERGGRSFTMSIPKKKMQIWLSVILFGNIQIKK